MFYDLDHVQTFDDWLAECEKFNALFEARELAPRDALFRWAALCEKVCDLWEAGALTDEEENELATGLRQAAILPLVNRFVQKLKNARDPNPPFPN